MSGASEDRSTRLVLVRHGESNVTVNRVIGGFRSCSGLSDLGRRQAERLAQRWAQTSEIAADVLVSSDFPRAIETAEFVRAGLGEVLARQPFERVAGFGEHDPGPEIDGMSFASYVERFGTPDWSGDPHVEVFPGGETTAQFHRRVELALTDLLTRHNGKCVVIVCHGGVIDAVFRHLMKTPMTGVYESFTLNTSITEFSGPSTKGVWRLLRYNDASHLDGLPAATASGET